MTGDDDDPWDMFGSDEDDEERENKEVGESWNDELDTMISELVQNSTRIWMKMNPGVRLSERIVGMYSDVASGCLPETIQQIWKKSLLKRGITVVETRETTSRVSDFEQPLYDGIVCLVSDDWCDRVDEDRLRKVTRLVVPSGLVAMPRRMFDLIRKKFQLWRSGELSTTLIDEKSGSWTLCQRHACQVQGKLCRWLPSGYSVEAELARAAKVTVVLSMSERREQKMTPQSAARAVKAMENHGFCIIAGGLVDPVQADRYGKAAMSDLEAVAEVLQGKVDLFESGSISQEGTTYREISQREHFRVDIRHGPALSNLRGTAGNSPQTITAQVEKTNDFLRGNADILHIIRTVMNPIDQSLSPGNFGRYNFDGRGPDGSFQDIRVGPVGAIITWPGATDQALHSDTPHLFENLAALPAHYINIFTPGANVDIEDEDFVGQTGFLSESHRLDVTACYKDSTLLSSKSTDGGHSVTTELWKNHLVRPKLRIGDVVLFDCRILHFGLPNESKRNTARPLLYTNVTMHWFHDPKNWGTETSIFPSAA